MEFSLAVFFIIALASIHSGAALECYSCNSKTEPSCKEMEGDKLESFKTECNTKALDDAKKAFNTVSHAVSDWGNKLGLNIGKTTIDAEMTCQKVEIESKENSYVLRSCSVAKKDSDDMCEYLKSQMNTDSVKVNCNQCKDNLCNSSGSVAPTVFSIFVTLSAILFYQQ